MSKNVNELYIEMQEMLSLKESIDAHALFPDHRVRVPTH